MFRRSFLAVLAALLPAAVVSGRVPDRRATRNGPALLWRKRGVDGFREFETAGQMAAFRDSLTADGWNPAGEGEACCAGGDHLCVGTGATPSAPRRRWFLRVVRGGWVTWFPIPTPGGVPCRS